MDNMIDEILEDHKKLIERRKNMPLSAFYGEYISEMQLTHSEKCLIMDFIQYVLRWRTDW